MRTNRRIVRAAAVAAAAVSLLWTAVPVASAAPTEPDEIAKADARLHGGRKKGSQVDSSQLLSEGCIGGGDSAGAADSERQLGGKGGKGGSKGQGGPQVAADACVEAGYQSSGGGGKGKGGSKGGSSAQVAGSKGSKRGWDVGEPSDGMSEEFCDVIKSLTDDGFATEAPTATPDPWCGCEACTDSVWNTRADGFTCGERIRYVHGQVGYPKHTDACKLVSLEFPSICGACNPDTCGEIAEPSEPVAESESESEDEDPTPTAAPSAADFDVNPQPEVGDAAAPTAAPVAKPTGAPVADPTSTPTGTPKATPQNEHCGCKACTEEIWNTDADGATCGARIDWLMNNGPYLSEMDACRLVAGDEHVQTCGPYCNPDLCDRAVTPKCGCYECDATAWNLPADGFTCGERIEWLMGTGVAESEACEMVTENQFAEKCGTKCNPIRCDGRKPATPDFVPEEECELPPLRPDSSLYCYPDYNDRLRWENVWGKYVVEVKESGDDAGLVCGPNDNRFTRNTVSLEGDDLTLQYKKVDGEWQAAEVRITLPPAEMPYRYGEFYFYLKSVQVLDSTNNNRQMSQTLPPSLVLSMFTWDTTDQCPGNELKREVDIEISRWDDVLNRDAQFLVQPAEFPHFVRFHTGEVTASTDGGNDLDPETQQGQVPPGMNPPALYQQGGHEWGFSWNPGQLSWWTSAGGARRHAYSTKQAVALGIPDRVQCLPADIEVRINLWNMFSSFVQPTDMEDSHVAEVVIGWFEHRPSGLVSVDELDGVCTRSCQCGPEGVCANGACVTASG